MSNDRIENLARAARRWPCVLDTNVLIRGRSELPDDEAERSAVERALAGMAARGNPLYTIPLVLVEFWHVARRNLNGLGLTPTQAREELSRIETFAPCLPDTPEVLAEWRALLNAHNVAPAQAYDVYIAATLRTHPALRGSRDPRLLTFNAEDFRPYAGDGLFRVVPPDGVDGPPDAP